jgi:hypothetical protein
MSEAQQVSRAFEVLMADASSISVNIGITLEAEDMGMLGSKTVRFFSPHDLLSDLQTELALILSLHKTKTEEEESIDG